MTSENTLLYCANQGKDDIFINNKKKSSRFSFKDNSKGHKINKNPNAFQTSLNPLFQYQFHSSTIEEICLSKVPIKVNSQWESKYISALLTRSLPNIFEVSSSTSSNLGRIKIENKDLLTYPSSSKLIGKKRKKKISK